MKNRCKHKVYTELCKEQEECRDRIDKIYNAIYDENKMGISKSQKDLLRVQAQTMETYASILELRKKDLDV